MKVASIFSVLAALLFALVIAGAGANSAVRDASEALPLRRAVSGMGGRRLNFLPLLKKKAEISLPKKQIPIKKIPFIKKQQQAAVVAAPPPPGGVSGAAATTAVVKKEALKKEALKKFPLVKKQQQQAAPVAVAPPVTPTAVSGATTTTPVATTGVVVG